MLAAFLKTRSSGPGAVTGETLYLYARKAGDGSGLLWAIEDCRPLSRRLERDLLAAGQSIVRVPPKLMAHVRDSARTYGKSDPIDALAVARAAQREADLRRDPVEPGP